MEKILLDTDIGGDIDDAICLAYLLREPRCQLMGITTVSGEPEKRASVASALCKATGREVPIVAGLDKTLQPIPVYPTPGGAPALENWPHDSFEKSDPAAFMYRIIKAHPHEITLIAIGSMTNAAVLFQTYPDAASLLKGFYAMNGYFGHEPLPEPWYNWNAWADPLASKLVFAARTAVHRVVPLEVTQQLTLDASAGRRLFGEGDRLIQAALDFGNAWLADSNQLTLHDPLAAVWAFHPEICRAERGTVQVETQREEIMGRTLFTPSAAGNLEIAREVDRLRFYQILTDTLSRPLG